MVDAVPAVLSNARRPAATLALCCALFCVLLNGCTSSGSPADQYRSGHFREALAAYRSAAQDGDAAAANQVGVQYFVGLGTPTDRMEAFRWFEQAALAGHAGAQRNVGLMYLNGYGVKQDMEQAFGWLDLARQSGSKQVTPLLNQLPYKMTPNQMMAARARLAEEIYERTGRALHKVTGSDVESPFAN